MSDALNILFANGSGKITGKYAYFDQVRFWVVKPLDRKTLAELHKQCRGRVRVDDRAARFNARYRQRVNMFQPPEQALRWLAKCDHALINHVEVAIDYVLEGVPREEAWEFLDRHLIRRWHGPKQSIRIAKTNENRSGGTRYDAARRAANMIVLYGQSHSRITGELNCLHMEWRLGNMLSCPRMDLRLFCQTCSPARGWTCDYLFKPKQPHPHSTTMQQPHEPPPAVSGRCRDT